VKAIAVAAAGLFVTACWKTEKPVVHACGTPGVFGSEPSEGAFTILPSRVPGLEITDASWRTRGGSEEFVYTELLSLRATLHASRTIPQDEIAVVYDAPGPHAFVDASLLEADRDQYHLNRAAPLVDSGGRLTVGLARELRSSWWIGPHSALTYCPRTVRAVPLSALVLTLVPELETRQGQAKRLRTSRQTAPLAIIMDTLVDYGLGSDLSVGAALNTTDSTLHDMVVGLVVERPPGAYQPEDGPPSPDTLEYFVGSVPPHALVGFGGGQFVGVWKVVRRVAYHPADVSGRAIAEKDEYHRASEAARLARIRARQPTQ